MDNGFGRVERMGEHVDVTQRVFADDLLLHIRQRITPPPAVDGARSGGGCIKWIGGKECVDKGILEAMPLMSSEQVKE